MKAKKVGHFTMASMDRYALSVGLNIHGIMKTMDANKNKDRIKMEHRSIYSGLLKYYIEDCRYLVVIYEDRTSPGYLAYNVIYNAALDVIDAQFLCAVEKNKFNKITIFNLSIWPHNNKDK
jgi:hypothetical protein